MLAMKCLFQVFNIGMYMIQLFESNNVRCESTRLENRKSQSPKFVDDIALDYEKVTKMAIILARHPLRACEGVLVET